MKSLDDTFKSEIKFCTTTTDLFHVSNINLDLQLYSEKRTADSKSQDARFTLLKIPISIGYYSLIIPFRLNNDGIISKRFVQRILCGIGHFLTLHRFLTDLRKFPYSRLQKGPVDLFLFLQKISSITRFILCIKILWLDSEKFLQIVHLISKSDYLSRKKSLLTSKRSILIIGMSSLLVGLWTQLLGVRIINVLSYRDPISYYKKYILETRYAFFLANHTNMSISAPGLQDITYGDQILLGIAYFGDTCRNISGMFWDNLILVGILTLWQHAKAFSEEIQTQLDLLNKDPQSLRPLQMESIMWKYKELKVLARLINGTFEWLVLSHSLEAILFYSIYIKDIFLAFDWFRQLKIGYMIFEAVLTFTFASEISRQVQVMRAFLSHESVGKFLPEARICILLDELSNHPISISGGLFTLNYQATGMIVTTIATYFIICSQIEIHIVN